MANPLPYLMEDPKKQYKTKVKGRSFFPFIFSIFIYISLFYVFNLSPSTLFNNTKFWFLISNTLILIIAADYGAFSSSKDESVYDEYFMHSEARRSSFSFVLEHQEIAMKNGNTIKQEDPVEDMQEKKEKESQPLENKLQIVAINEQENPNTINQEDQDHIQEKRIVHVGKKDSEKEKNINERGRNSTCRRSKSEKVKRVVIDESDESKNSVVLRRSETKMNDQENHEGEVMNDFSTMSDEDLNKRVEEFIQRFNRQIRLQARVYDNL